MFVEINFEVGIVMKRILPFLTAILMLCSICGCGDAEPPAQIAATTLPVYEFTSRLCEGTEITVTRLVTENVSCLHDYSLNVRQVRAAEAAELIVISGAGLEVFMADLLHKNDVIDSSVGITLIECSEDHGHDHSHHHHEADSHIWLSPENAKIMARNICTGLSAKYPEHNDTFEANLTILLDELDKLHAYGLKQLADLKCRQLITFHDGFAYLAQCYDLQILEAVEEESGSEASAAELIHLIEEVQTHHLPAIFTEAMGSVSAAQIIANETGTAVFTLDMAMHGDSYFSAMYHNINTLKGALE
jgi:ABC-type Zn uptake system ZnuABC Zn-binding protein ZnuA